MIEGLLLPRPHISWSSYSCWKSSPDRFRREYFEKGRRLDTKHLRFGKGIAKMIELGTHKDILPDLPIYPIHEFEIKVEVCGVPILSYLDGDDPENNEFGEYKTGIHPWTQSKVQKHDQLTFYAMAKRAKEGKMPERCNLHWIETTEESANEPDFWTEVDKPISVTGRIETFVREFDERELDRMENELVKVALQISDAYKAFIQELL